VHDLFVPYHQIFDKCRPVLFVQTIRVEVWNGKLDAEMAENRY
jgi:hypothetical protein